MNISCWFVRKCAETAPPIRCWREYNGSRLKVNQASFIFSPPKLRCWRPITWKADAECLAGIQRTTDIRRGVINQQRRQTPIMYSVYLLPGHQQWYWLWRIYSSIFAWKAFQLSPKYPHRESIGYEKKWSVWCQKQVSQACISNCIPQYSGGRGGGGVATIYPSWDTCFWCQGPNRLMCSNISTSRVYWFTIVGGE